MKWPASFPFICLCPFFISSAIADDAVPDPQTVVVRATRNGLSAFNTAASVDVIEGSTLRAGRPGINLSEGLGGVPGLQIKDRQNYAQDLQLSIRGFGARSSFGVRGIRLYLDGIPATMPDGQAQTSNIDIASTDRVEIVRGPFSALYGNASGGVIQVYTQEGAMPTLKSSAAAGSFGMRRYDVQAGGTLRDTPDAPDVSYSSGIRYLVGTSRFTTGGYRMHSEASKDLTNAKFSWKPDAGSKITLLVNSVDLEAQDPLGLTRQQYETTPRSAALAQQYDTRKTVQQTQQGLAYEKQFDGGDKLNMMTYYGQRDTAQFQAIPVAAQINPASAGGVIALGRIYDGVDLRWSHQARLMDMPLLAIAGLAYDNLLEHRTGYENYTGTNSSAATATNTPAIASPLPGALLGEEGRLRRNENNTARNIDYYFQTHWDLAKRWALDAGVRHSSIRFASADHYIVQGNGDDSGTAQYEAFLPAASLLYRPASALNVYLSAGRGFETPTLNEIAYRPGNLPGLNFGLQPSSSVNLELGAKARLGKEYGLLNAAVFQTATDREIVTDTNIGGRATYRNGGRTLRRGIELEWSADLRNDWRSQIAYTFLDATYRDTVCITASCGAATPPAILAGAQLPGVARHSLYLSLEWAPPQAWRAAFETRYASRVWADDRNSDAAPGYVTAGLGGGYLWKLPHLDIAAYARIDNLFDRAYAGSVIVNEGNARYFEPAPGRNGSAGVTLSYVFR